MELGPYGQHARRRLNAVGDPEEQLVMHQLAGTPKCVADGRLAHRQAGGGACHVPFEHHGFDDPKQVEVEPRIIHLGDGDHLGL